ncbi:hypothetical protein BH24ACT1_BH24ACT1_04780 [soil metagenome]
MTARFCDGEIEERRTDMQKMFNRRSPSAIPRQARSARLFLAAAVTVLGSVGLAGTASAQYVTPEPPRGGVSTDVQTQPVVDATGTAAGEVTGQVATRSSGQGLPVTGGDVLGLTAIGVGAIAAGGVVLRLRRRATQS